VKIAYFDCPAGASGDMILGALVDCGLAGEDLRRRLADLDLPGYTLAFQRVVKNGISATQAEVSVTDQTSERRLTEIDGLVKASHLSPAIQEKALAIFHRLGEVEARIHGQPVDEVHLHELGGIDTLVDVTGALLGLEALGIEQVWVSPLPLGRGFTRSAHGPLPLPAPATLALLEGAPVLGSEIDAELVTPTGAAVLTGLAHRFGPIPPMILQHVGYGAGRRDLPIPNVLRLLVGETSSPDGVETESLVMLETNIDNLNPEFYEHVMGRLFVAGALDVFLSPIQMKKNRPATLLHALCRPAQAEALAGILYAETSTLGIRQQTLIRHALPRWSETVHTPFGPVQVKFARWGEGQVKFAPEYEDCLRLAIEHGVPLREVYRAAETVASVKTTKLTLPQVDSKDRTNNRP
jgi:uncharacterized protein (TIGR00299 family) protein